MPLNVIGGYSWFGISVPVIAPTIGHGEITIILTSNQQVDSTVVQIMSSHDTAGIMDLLPSAHEQLSGRNSWLVNFGASGRMTGRHDFVINVSSINLRYIDLPNGSSTVANFEGSAVLS